MVQMKQLALQSQNASATDRLALQASLLAKQKVIAKKLATAEFGGVNIFTNTSVDTQFIVGNGLNLSANIDAVTGKSLVNTAGIINGLSAGGNAWNNGIDITEIDVEVKIYGKATINLANPATITAGDRIYLSDGSVALLTFYTGGGPNPPTQGSLMIIGSTSGSPGVAAGNNLRFTSLNGVTVDFFGSQLIANFNAGNTIIDSGVFKVRMTGAKIAAAHDLTITSTGSNGVIQVGAIGQIDNTGLITPGTACTINTAKDAIIAANVIEAGMDQMRAMINKIDNAYSALDGVSETQVRLEESLGEAIEELTAADITECMSEIIAGQMLLQYSTMVWLCQKRLEQLALDTFKKAVAGTSR